MKSEQIEALKAILKAPRKVAIIPHRSPDGDAMGSTLALCQFLNAKGHQSTVIAPNSFPEFLNWMPGSKKVLFYDKETVKANEVIEEAEIIFTLDFNSLSRTGTMTETLKKAKSTFVMIDHHREPEDYADFMYSDISASSTCELIYNFIEKLGQTDQITSEMAACLYTGIMTDTGSFRFPSTTSQTHRIIANLIDKGANNAQIYQNIFEAKSTGQLKLLGVALDNMKVLEDYQTAYITLSQEELDKNNFKQGDTEGFVNYGLKLKNVIFAAIFIEHKKENIIKISLRSKGDFDVNTVARKHFSGGGHLNAAGGKSEKSLQETSNYFENLLELYKSQLEK